MRTNLTTALLALAMISIIPASGFSHCQVPCGIYGDQTRLDLLAEHITTIEKSMNQITELSAAGEKNYNQLVRWVNNKEDHAQAFQDIVTAYFMAQRIKPVESTEADYTTYQQKLTLLHKMLVTAMKCKQTTDLAHVEALKLQLAEFSELYLAK